MKQITVDSLLVSPQDAVTFQAGWSTAGRGRLLLVALFAGSVGPGLYMVAHLSSFPVGRLVGFLIVALGYGLPHMLFLGRIERFWRGVMMTRTSWISRGFVFATLFLGFALAELAIDYYAGAPLSGALLPIVGWAAFGLAFLVALYPGFLFSRVKAIPLWHSFLLVPLFLVQAAGAGIALVLVLAGLLGRTIPRAHELLIAEAVLLLLSALLISAHLFSRSGSGEAGRTSVVQLVRGKFRNTFVFGAILGEIVIPVSMVGIVLLGADESILIVAEMIQICGIFLFKYCILNAGAYNRLCDEGVFESLHRRGDRIRPFN